MKAQALLAVQDLTKVEAGASGEYEAEIPPPLALTDLPPALAATLQHIVNKLDMVTQVVGMMEERLSLNEDKLMALEQHLRALLPKESHRTETQTAQSLQEDPAHGLSTRTSCHSDSACLES